MATEKFNQGNPSDKYGSLASQMFVTAIVVDNKDPNETGRIKCRIDGEQDDQGKIPDNKLPWYQCVTPNQPQVGGIGSFPAGNYETGSKIIMLNLGQQGYVILGAMPNSLTDKSKQDRDMESTSTSKRAKFVGPKMPAMVKSFLGTWAGYVDGTTRANEVRNAIGAGPFLHQATQNAKEGIHMLSGIPKYLGGRLGIKIPDGKPPLAIGSFPINLGDVTNPQKYIEKAVGTPGELIPNALKMVESLKQTAVNKLNIPGVQSIGGIQNLIGAVQGILSLIKEAGGNEKSEKELTLYQIYKNETGLDALDKDKNETPEYKIWLEQYLRREEQITEPVEQPATS